MGDREASFLGVNQATVSDRPPLLPTILPGVATGGAGNAQPQALPAPAATVIQQPPPLGYKVIPLDLTNARDNTAGPLEVSGSGFAVWDSTNSTDLIFVQADSEQAGKLPCRLGGTRGVSGRTFRRLFLTWAAQPGSTLTLVIFEDAAQAPTTILR